MPLLVVANASVCAQSGYLLCHVGFLGLLLPRIEGPGQLVKCPVCVCCRPALSLDQLGVHSVPAGSADTSALQLTACSPTHHLAETSHPPEGKHIGDPDAYFQQLKAFSSNPLLILVLTTPMTWRLYSWISATCRQDLSTRATSRCCQEMMACSRSKTHYTVSLMTLHRMPFVYNVVGTGSINQQGRQLNNTGAAVSCRTRCHQAACPPTCTTASLRLCLVTTAAFQPLKAATSTLWVHVVGSAVAQTSAVQGIALAQDHFDCSNLIACWAHNCACAPPHLLHVPPQHHLPHCLMLPAKEAGRLQALLAVQHSLAQHLTATLVVRHKAAPGMPGSLQHLWQDNRQSRQIA